VAMTDVGKPPIRPGLYYPIYGFESERWLKAAALYWPSLVRLMPEPIQIAESETATRLADELGFISQRPPGDSVNAVADRLLSLIAEHGDALRARLGLPADVRRQLTPVGSADQVPLTWDEFLTFETYGLTHVGKVHPAVREALIECGLAAWPTRPIAGILHDAGRPALRARGGGLVPLGDPRADLSPDTTWIVMHDDLIVLLSSILAADFAKANRLAPVTFWDFAFAQADEWTGDELAEILVGRLPGQQPTRLSGDVAQRIGLLAVELVVPAGLEDLPVDKIIEIRQRYGAEFLAFRHEVDQAASELEELSDIRDEAVLDLYLRDVVTERFVKPTQELRRLLGGLRLESATAAINVKTELPAGTLLSAAAYATGHPLVAATSAAALAVLVAHRGYGQQRRSAFQASPSASFLLHARDTIHPRGLLEQTMGRLHHLAGARE
jgi:hypothetical protein